MQVFRSKTLNTLLIVMACFTLAGAGVFYYLSHKAHAKDSPPSIGEVVDHLSVTTDEITTNLKDNKFIKVTFLIEVSNKKAKSELEKRQFQVNNEILYLLSNKSEADLNGEKGLQKLETSLQEKLNNLMKNGTIVHVYTTEKIIQ
nr:flagellar basal body-associated protein FliL [Pullulanibacillus pueri]